MKGKLIKTLFIGVVCISALIGTTSYIQVEPQLPKNFHQVDDGIYRSSQPSLKEMKALEAMGINVMLNLRNYHDNIKKLRKSDIVQIHLPMRAMNIRHKDVVRAMKILGKAEKPILIHCLKGADRTGCIVASYRMVYQGWSKEDAIADFLNDKYGYSQGAFPGILEYLQKLDVESLKKDVFNN